MSGQTTTELNSSTDVVAFLVGQHGEIKERFQQVLDSGGHEREVAFFELRRLLAVHEAAEEQIVHPRSRLTLTDGDVIVNARLREEQEAKETLAELEELRVSSPEFVEKLVQLRNDVLAHATHEEQYEFARLDGELDDRQRARMAHAARLAEQLAPTRPHPNIELAGEHLIIGPFAAMLDRARDAISKPHD